jgi:hypothetical protein
MSSTSTDLVTGLSARTFAVWTLLAGVIRFHAAYDIHNPTYCNNPIPTYSRLYDLTMWTFGLAWIHFVSEWTIYKTAGVGGGLLSPVIVASTFLIFLKLILATSFIWMITQRQYYVGVSWI